MFRFKQLFSSSSLLLLLLLFLFLFFLLLLLLLMLLLLLRMFVLLLLVLLLLVLPLLLQTPFSKHSRNGKTPPNFVRFGNEAKHHLISCRKRRKSSCNNSPRRLERPFGNPKNQILLLLVLLLMAAAAAAAAATATIKFMFLHCVQCRLQFVMFLHCVQYRCCCCW